MTNDDDAEIRRSRRKSLILLSLGMTLNIRTYASKARGKFQNHSLALNS